MANGVYKNHSRLHGALLSSYTKIGVDTGLEFTAISAIIFYTLLCGAVYLFLLIIQHQFELALAAIVDTATAATIAACVSLIALFTS